MAAGGEDDLICDLAETYHVLDWRGLPLRTAAALAAGLPEDCRCRRRGTGLRVPLRTLLLARIADSAALLVWSRTDDAKKGRNPPALLAEKLVDRPRQSNVKVFRSKEDFDRMYQAMTGGT